MTASKMNILNKFFVRSTFRQCITNGRDSTYKQVISKYIVSTNGKSNSELISEVYAELKKNYRNEYFYKNTLLNKLLLGVHNIKTTTALTEIPIAKSKADFVLINGKAAVYEIKTELDNLDRLENQINDYFKAFDHVSVVTYKENVSVLQDKLDAIGKPVGLYVLQKNGTLSTIREPGEYKQDIDSRIIFKILRKCEYEQILISYYGSLPETTAFKYYSVCKELFEAIPIDYLYSQMLKLLKARNTISSEQLKSVPYELKFLVYFMNLKKQEYAKLEAFLSAPYGGD